MTKYEWLKNQVDSDYRIYCEYENKGSKLAVYFKQIYLVQKNQLDNLTVEEAGEILY